MLTVVIVVAAVTVTYFWFQSYITSQTTAAGSLMKIENVHFYDSNKIDITVRNIGTADLTVDRVYINGVAYSVEKSIAVGESETVTVQHSWTGGQEYQIRVVNKSGLFMEGTYTAPYESTHKVWYNPSWTRRKPITVNNTLNPNDLSGYQVRVSVQYDSDMNNDFSDLRFTDSDRVTLISYWMESYVPSDHAVVWVKVPSISAHSVKTIYMYYGNPSADSESNPDDTFEVFVNFTRDGVTSHGGSGQDRDPTQWEIIDDTTLRMWGNNWKATVKTVNVNGDGSQAVVFDFKSVGAQVK